MSSSLMGERFERGDGGWLVSEEFGVVGVSSVGIGAVGDWEAGGASNASIAASSSSSNVMCGSSSTSSSMRESFEVEPMSVKMGVP